MDIKRYKFINIVIGAIGVLLCISSGIIPTKAGLLADESVSLIQITGAGRMITSFIVPVALMLLALIFVIIGKFDIMALFAAIAGGVLFIFTDLSFIKDNQTYIGVLLNVIGIILVLSSICLQMFATGEKVNEEVQEDSPDTDSANFYEDIVTSNDVQHIEDTLNIFKIQETENSDKDEVVTDFFSELEKIFSEQEQNGGDTK